MRKRQNIERRPVFAGYHMRVNGKEVHIAENTALSSYLQENGYDMTRIAVERNGEIIPKAMYTECVLNDNDTLEIVQFVGGG
jgi:sulfur carrier protein